MWGNYADCHKGVCLIYDTGDEAKLKVGGRHIPLEVRAISYGGESITCLACPEGKIRLRIGQADVKTW